MNSGNRAVFSSAVVGWLKGRLFCFFQSYSKVRLKIKCISHRLAVGVGEFLQNGNADWRSGWHKPKNRICKIDLTPRTLNPSSLPWFTRIRPHTPTIASRYRGSCLYANSMVTQHPQTVGLIMWSIFSLSMQSAPQDQTKHKGGYWWVGLVRVIQSRLVQSVWEKER